MRLPADAPTRGEAGIRIAYDVAAQNFINSGVNRVILATDRPTEPAGRSEKLGELPEAELKNDVPLTVLNFGIDDSKKEAELVAGDKKAKARRATINSAGDAQRALAQEMGEAFDVIAKDVAIQVRFNAAGVEQYRLIGSDNPGEPAQGATGEGNTAGEIVAGHHVTALYEIMPRRERPGCPLHGHSII